MTTATIEEVQASLPSLLSGLKPGEELVILQQGQPVARLVAEPVPALKSRQPGSAVGKLRIIQEDDEHLEDFKEYMS
jgi:antitoxin (DNA-binding transcriptional repressor) of toxin-antitoxin stability system